VKRVAILGASNVALGLSTICRLLSTSEPQPVQLVAACGHGRAYGRETRVGPRSLSSLSECGIWSTLEATPESADETLAVLTDIGNDALYGDTFDRMLERIDRCIVRLQPYADRIVVTQMPVESIRGLSYFGYHVVSRFFFPAVRPRPYERIFNELSAGAERLAEVVAKRDAILLERSAEWYGIDPIHIRSDKRETAWRTILQLPNLDESARRNGSVSLPYWRRRPERMRLFGLNLDTPQPVSRSEHFEVSLY